LETGGVKSRPTETIAVEVCRAKLEAEAEVARLMLADPTAAKGMAWSCRVTRADFAEPDLALAFIAATEAARLRLGRFAALRATLHAWRWAGWYAPGGVGCFWDDVRLAAWMAELTARLDWRRTYRADLRRWCERLRDLNARLAAASRYESLARAALMGDVTEAVPLRRAG
jgi:hypothetical protein